MKNLLAVLLTLTFFASAGCHRSSSAPRETAHAAAVTRRGQAEIGGQPGYFDYYVLNLSWSPEFCAGHMGSPGCSSRPGFIVHGLWPQNIDGTYPEDCADPTVPTYLPAYLDLMPTADLITHEWKTHGTCSGLLPDGYFANVRRALRSVEIPPMFAASQTPPTSISPATLLDLLAQSNPSFPRSSFAITCGENHLTAIEACFTKDLKPTACQGIRSCRARMIQIAPR